MIQVSPENRAERLEWSPPVLEQLTVDLDAIASSQGTCSDNNGAASNKFCS